MTKLIQLSLGSILFSCLMIIILGTTSVFAVSVYKLIEIMLR